MLTSFRYRSCLWTVNWHFWSNTYFASCRTSIKVYSCDSAEELRLGVTSWKQKNQFYGGSVYKDLYYLVPDMLFRNKELRKEVKCFTRNAITAQASPEQPAALRSLYSRYNIWGRSRARPAGSVMMIPGPDLQIELTHQLTLHKCCSVSRICFMTEIWTLLALLEIKSCDSQ